MKVVKKLLKVVLWIVVIVVVALLAMPLWFGPVAKGVANSVAPKMLGTKFHVGHLSLNPYTSRFELGELRVANPEGYSEEFAAKIGALVFDADTLSFAGDVIHIEEITVKDVFASYVSGGKDNVNNIDQIQYNLAGGKEKYEAAQAKKAAEAEGKSEPEKADDGKPAKKIVIDKLTISGVKVKYGLLPIAVPFDICLKDIGKEKNGATFAEVGEKIWSSILNAAGGLGDLTGKAAGAVGDGAKAVGDAAGKAAGAVGDAAGKAAGAVGDGAKKALDSIKDLW